MARPVRLACIQMPCFGIDHAREALDYALARTAEAAETGVDLVILPECTYPSYYIRSRRAFEQLAAPPPSEALALFQGLAAQYRCHMAVGMAMDLGDEDKLSNAAILIGPAGEIIGRYAKTFLWHFDAHWFTPGGQYPVFETALGRIGLMICADGRLPEITRAMALQGADLIVNTTAWVSTGRNAQQLTNPQFEYMIPVRSRENNVWIASANKVGMEEESIVYCGRSCVVDPSGRLVAAAAPDSPEILRVEIDLDVGLGLPIGRRPSSYGVLGKETINLPVIAALDEAVIVSSTCGLVAALQLGAYETAEGFLLRAQHLIHLLATQDVNVIVFPDIPSGSEGTETYTSAACLGPLTAMTQEYECSVVVVLAEQQGGARYKTAYFISAGEVLFSYRAAHLSSDELRSYTQGSGEYAVVKTPDLGNVGVMIGAEGWVPEVARCLMLEGADVILWSGGRGEPQDTLLARCRADENRLFVIRAAIVGPESSAVAAAPGGRVLGEGLPGIEQAVFASLDWADARCKNMTPHTNVVLNRMPATYGALYE
ncbi:MAG: carbon-nitrogen hydrolase family protein [Chloroflexota bacterium]|nr:MAG: carbon-nitrogen hydrolase family protein [Chloroflexota bacterium]